MLGVGLPGHDAASSSTPLLDTHLVPPCMVVAGMPQLVGQATSIPFQYPATLSVKTYAGVLQSTLGLAARQ